MASRNHSMCNNDASGLKAEAERSSRRIAAFQAVDAVKLREAKQRGQTCGAGSGEALRKI